MSDEADVYSWPPQSQDSEKYHLCACIGCCRKCGQCRTNPDHTSEYCDLLVKQAKEREKFFKKGRPNKQ